jgi:hypothetical protein
MGVEVLSTLESVPTLKHRRGGAGKTAVIGILVRFAKQYDQLAPEGVR